MKAGQKFALILGILYFAIGIMGFVPGFVTQPESVPGYVSAIGIDSGFGYLFGLFPVNSVHNVVHLIVGIAGIIASVSLDSARLYSGFLGIFYSVLTVMGLIPITNTTFGLMPIYRNDIWINAATAAIAIYFGFIADPNLRDLYGQQLGDKREAPIGDQTSSQSR